MAEIMLGLLDDFPPDDYRVLAIGEFEVGIFRFGQELVAWENNCPHFAGPVCQGRMFRKVDETILPDQTSAGLRFGERHHVVCPWHGFEFDLKTGRHPGDPRYRLRSVPVTVRDQQIFLSLPEYASSGS